VTFQQPIRPLYCILYLKNDAQEVVPIFLKNGEIVLYLLRSKLDVLALLLAWICLNILIISISLFKPVCLALIFN
jgi:hypothetical protein